jgi:hypothetical protein
MLKLSKSKGQWFIISAVIASGAFLAISILFRSFFSVDAAEIASTNHDNFLASVEDGIKKTISESDCANLERNLNEYRYFSQENLAAKSYLLDVRYKVSGCSANIYLILLSSSSMDSWIGVRPEVDSLIANPGGGQIDSITINLKSRVPYNTTGNISIIDDSGFLGSVVFDIPQGTTTLEEQLNSGVFAGTGARLKIFGHLFFGEKTFFV